MWALMLVRLMSNEETALSHQAGVKRSRLWLDSMTVLHWIMNHGEWKQFVRHRVNEILKLSVKTEIFIFFIFLFFYLHYITNTTYYLLY